MKALLLLALLATPAFAMEGEEVVATDAPSRDFGIYLEAHGSDAKWTGDSSEGPSKGFGIGFVYFLHDYLSLTQRYVQSAADIGSGDGRLRTVRLELEARSYLDVADAGAVFAALSPGWTTRKVDFKDEIGVADDVTSGASVGLAAGYEHEVADLSNVGVIVRYTHMKGRDDDDTALEVGVFTSILTY